MVAIDLYIIMAISLVVMVKFSDITITNVIKISKLTGIASMTMGFILLAFITSLPELAVVITSSLKGEAVVGISTLFGSNIADLVILGIISLFVTFNIPIEDRKSMTQVILVTSMIAFFAFVLGSIGLIFGVFSVIIFYLISKPIVYEGVPEKYEIRTVEILKSGAMILLGLTVVLVSAAVVTDTTIAIAQSLNIRESFLGASVIAISTSLPELIVSLSAMRKGNINLVVGNILGSLMVNLTLLLGLASILSTISLDAPIRISIGMLLVVNAIFLLMMQTKFTKKQGVILIGLYFIFLFILYGVSV